MRAAGSRMEEMGADKVWLYFWNIMRAWVQNGRFGVIRSGCTFGYGCVPLFSVGASGWMGCTSVFCRPGRVAQGLGQ